jgi:hypothetical protein
MLGYPDRIQCLSCPTKASHLKRFQDDWSSVVIPVDKPLALTTTSPVVAKINKLAADLCRQKTGWFAVVSH